MVLSELIKTSCDKTLISLGLENTGVIISLAILTSAAPRSICRFGKKSPVFSRPQEIGPLHIYVMHDVKWTQ